MSRVWRDRTSRGWQPFKPPGTPFIVRCFPWGLKVQDSILRRVYCPFGLVQWDNNLGEPGFSFSSTAPILWKSEPSSLSHSVTNTMPSSLSTRHNSFSSENAGQQGCTDEVVITIFYNHLYHLSESSSGRSRLLISIAVHIGSVRGGIRKHYKDRNDYVIL